MKVSEFSSVQSFIPQLPYSDFREVEKKETEEDSSDQLESGKLEQELPTFKVKEKNTKLVRSNDARIGLRNLEMLIVRSEELVKDSFCTNSCISLANNRVSFLHKAFFQVKQDVKTD